ncbi:MAG: 2-phospho-L-lactate transferase [Candidatus Bathyarchaeota archaeon]|nr:2-phospho-L-lactate transferase [Candidatus Bathyarchaeota archaeon]
MVLYDSVRRGFTLKVTALAGGVGAARFLTGLTQLIPQKDLTVIVNTGDDIELFGLHISPDIDIVTYTLAGIVDEAKGWGIRGDTFHCLSQLKALGEDTWFNLGDQDLATHIYRTQRLQQGATLLQVTEEIRQHLGVKTKILPMSNDRFETRIVTPNGSVHFEEYFVKRQCKDEVLGVEFVGQATAKPAMGVLEAIDEADLVVVCPSNPLVSIGTILSVQGVREALKKTSAYMVGVSPIVAGAAIKGPADKMLRGLGLEVSAVGVAGLYCDFLDALVIDSQDAELKVRVEKLGLKVTVANTVMKSLEDKVALAKAVLDSKVSI